MEENEDFMPFDQNFSEAEIYLLELQVRKGGMLPLPDGFFSKIDMSLQHIRDENIQGPFDMPLEILQRLLSNESWYLRQWVIKYVIDGMKADTPVDFIVTALNDTQEEVRLSVLQSCKLLTLTDVVFITNKVAKALLEDQAAEQPALHALKLLSKIVIDLQEEGKEAKIDIHLEVLRFFIIDPRWELRQWAIEYTMSIRKGNTPVDFFVSALSDTDERVCLSALRIFDDMDNDRIILASALSSAISSKRIEEKVAFQVVNLLRDVASQSLEESSKYAAAKNTDMIAPFHRPLLPPCSCG